MLLALESNSDGAIEADERHPQSDDIGGRRSKLHAEWSR